MRKVIQGTYLDYLFLFGDSRTAFSDLAVQSAEKFGKLYLMMETDRAVGYLCTENEENYCTVLHAYTLPERRNTGIFTELLKTVREESDRVIRLSIAENKACFRQVDHVRRKLGFVTGSSCMIFSGKSENFVNWETYMTRTGNTFCRILLNQGFQCVSFAEAGNEMLNELYDSEKSDFHNHLDVRLFLDNQSRCLDREMSFLAIKDGVLAAYTLVRRPDRFSAVFEHISAHEKYIGSGCILLPFARSMGMFKEKGCSRAVYAMYEDNNHANAFRKKLLGKVTSSQKRSYNFFYKK